MLCAGLQTLAVLNQEMIDDALRKVNPDFKDWQMRDLRRTARTLMTRAGVSREIAERCLGHELPGIERTYNRYAYTNEQREAFDKLAKMVERIIHSPTGNVVDMPKRKRG